jgi:excisionase family DNA binding protein
MNAPDDRAAVVTVPVLLKVATVAAMLDCSPRTVRQRIADGELPAVRDHGCTMVRGDDLRAYIDALEAVGHTARSRNRPTRRSYAGL